MVYAKPILFPKICSTSLLRLIKSSVRLPICFLTASPAVLCTTPSAPIRKSCNSDRSADCLPFQSRAVSIISSIENANLSEVSAMELTINLKFVVFSALKRYDICCLSILNVGFEGKSITRLIGLPILLYCSSVISNKIMYAVAGIVLSSDLISTEAFK